MCRVIGNISIFCDCLFFSAVKHILYATVVRGCTCMGLCLDNPSRWRADVTALFLSNQSLVCFMYMAAYSISWFCSIFL